MEVFLKGFQCQRCGYQWKPRKAGTPKKCPGCDSAGWQVPKQRIKPLRGTPGRVIAEGLRGLTWPDDKFADDLEAIQASQPMEQEPDWPN